jgi:hypothetical protein
VLCGWWEMIIALKKNKILMCMVEEKAAAKSALKK